MSRIEASDEGLVTQVLFSQPFFKIQILLNAALGVEQTKARARRSVEQVSYGG